MVRPDKNDPEWNMGFDLSMCLTSTMLENGSKIEGSTKMKQKVSRGSGRIPQKGWTKMVQNATWSSGV